MVVFGSNENGETPDNRASRSETLTKAKRDARRAKRAAAKAAEKAADDARRETARARREALKVTIVDGNVVDDQGRILRPYSRIEQFLDNKPLVYSLLIVTIIACVLISFMLIRQ
jgi:hypothetical protein